VDLSLLWLGVKFRVNDDGTTPVNRLQQRVLGVEPIEDFGMLPRRSELCVLLRAADQIVSGVVVISMVAFLGGGLTCWGRPAAVEIFHGIIYGCERLELGEEGSGVVHWVRVDLTAPGIELYVTPLDPTAVNQGWQYRLRRVLDVVYNEELAVAINGTLFTSNAGWRPRLSGDLARGNETVVANHVVSHMWEHTYLLWFDDRLTPQLKPSKPPTAAELALAKWGIGGQSVELRSGKVWPGSSRIPNARTAVAIDAALKLLFLAVGTHISPHLMFQKLANLGAKDGMLLDGGDSSSMAFGRDVTGVSPGGVFGHWRPVATHFGVRARRIGAKAP
jgi:hypothetical protein